MLSIFDEQFEGDHNTVSRVDNIGVNFLFL